MDLRTLPDRWREDSVLLRRYGDERGAHVCELLAADLESALRSMQSEALTLSEASAESGYSERRLREMVAGGGLPNAGRKGAPRIRRADLPHKPGKRPAAGGYDPAADARAIMRARRADV
jgi:hypothetical protein